MFVYTATTIGSLRSLWKFVEGNSYDNLFLFENMLTRIFYFKKEKVPFLEFDNLKVESCY